MATAVRPGNGKTWEEVFKDIPDESPLWGLINSYLEKYALFGRFGMRDLPHDFSQDKWTEEVECAFCDKPKIQHPIEMPLDEVVLLSTYRSFKEDENFDKFDPVLFYQSILNMESIRDGDANSNARLGMKFGLWLYYLIHIGKLNPQVGHFIGQGFDGNSKAADKFLAGG